MSCILAPVVSLNAVCYVVVFYIRCPVSAAGSLQVGGQQASLDPGDKAKWVERGVKLLLLPEITALATQ